MKIDSILPVPPAMFSRPDPSVTLWDCWEKWKNSAPPGAGEQRDIALRRMETCIENASQPLDLSDLTLSSLPPYLPPTCKLTVSENLLKGLLSYTQLDRSIDNIIADYVDNILLYHFDGFFLHELNVDNSQFLTTLFSAETDPAHKIVERVALEFIAERDSVQERVRKELTKYINYIVLDTRSCQDVAFKAELDLLLHGEFCEAAYRCAINNSALNHRSPFTLFSR